MKPPRVSAAILLLFAAALLTTWLVIRPHSSVTSTAATPTRSGEPATPAMGPVSPAAVQPPTIPPSPSAADLVASTPATAALSSTDIGRDVHAEPTRASPPDTANPENARADAASINAIRVRRMITDYHTLTGENPVGTNAEIMAAVMGKNPRQATLGPPDGIELNPQGELVDAWGTPYFFHQLSRDVMEIHSAGPDKIMGTADDIVVR